MEESIRMTEGRDKWRKYVHGDDGVATVGSRTAKEQNRTVTFSFIQYAVTLYVYVLLSHLRSIKVGVCVCVCVGG